MSMSNVNAGSELFQRLSPVDQARVLKLQTTASRFRAKSLPSVRLVTTLVADVAPEPTKVAFGTFISALGTANLAILYSYNYRQRQRGVADLEIVEASIQAMRRKGHVPRTIYDYVVQNRGQLEALAASQKPIIWTLELDRLMLSLLWGWQTVEEVAYQLSEQTSILITTGAVKGRRYNGLAKRSRRELREWGLTAKEIAFVKPD